MSLVGALTKAAKAGETAKKTAPFYSAVDEALAAIARPKGTGAEFLTELSKQPGVKKAELADRKLEQAFKAKGKMTKEEAQQVLKENPPPQLKEKQYRHSDAMEEEDIRDEVAQRWFGRPYDEVTNNRHRREIMDETDRRMGEENGTLYGDYKIPGGEAYREILLKLPESRPYAGNYSDPAKYDADMRAFNASGKSDYQSSHWKDDPNVLAHMRVQDRKGPNGEKILHVEEIQSDWHQEGRKKGYKTGLTPEQQQEMQALLQKHADEDGLLQKDNARLTELIDLENKGVPDAPFKKNWHELAMKRLLNYAADKGYDSIAITPGSEQAKRFSLSRQLNEVLFDPNTGHLAGRDHDGKLVVAKTGVTTENLPDYIGKEGAQKILGTPADNTGVHALRGADLEVGGEGMKGFYDKILPDYLNNFGKPYGAQVESAVIPANKPELKQVNGKYQYVDNFVDYPLHVFKVTPEMRESIKQKGLPLYQQVGIPTVGAGAASQIPEEPEYGVGGMVNSAAKMEALAKLAKLREEMLPRAEAVKALIAKDESKYLRDVAPNSLTNAEIEAEIARMKARAEAAQPEVKKAVGGAINYDTVPDMFDEGRMIQGAPFKRGGKVNMTANRDTMFLELSNKKLKRK